jgi:hypothetical protein
MDTNPIQRALGAPQSSWTYPVHGWMDEFEQVLFGGMTGRSLLIASVLKLEMPAIPPLLHTHFGPYKLVSISHLQSLFCNPPFYVHLKHIESSTILTCSLIASVL